MRLDDIIELGFIQYTPTFYNLNPDYYTTFNRMGRPVVMDYEVVSGRIKLTFYDKNVKSKKIASYYLDTVKTKEDLQAQINLLNDNGTI